MQPCIRIFLGVNDNHERINAQGEALRDVRMTGLDRINIRHIDNNRVSRQSAGSLHPPSNSQPPQELTGRTTDGKNSARLVRRGTSNASGHDLSPAQSIHQRRLSRTRPAQHTDHTPRRINLAALGGNVDQLTNSGESGLINIRRSQRANLIKL